MQAPRIDPVEPARTTGKAKDFLEEVQARLGAVPNFVKTLAHSPAALEGYLALSRALAGSRLGARLREQVALAVAEANRCDYCLAVHSVLGKGAGLSPDEIAASRAGDASDAKAAAALRFARAVLRGRGDVEDEEFARVRAAGFDEGQITEIIVEVALHVLTNYFNKAMRVVVDFPQPAALSPVG
jgi:uncharacterized peroxidase-related enzyme